MISRSRGRPGLCGWIQGNHKIFKKKKQKTGGRRVKSETQLESEDATLLTLKMDEGATIQGIQAASRNWKK